MKRFNELTMTVFLAALLALACGGSGGSDDEDVKDLCEEYCGQLIDCNEGEGDEDACVEACLEYAGEGDANFDDDCEDAAYEAIECLADLKCNEEGCEDEFAEVVDECAGEVSTCDNDDEIDIEFVCDGVPDCDDGEDEDFCP